MSHITVISLNSFKVSTRHESRGRRSSIFPKESVGDDFGTTKGSSQCRFVFDYMTCVALNSGDADFLSSKNSQQCLIKVLAQLIRFNFVILFFL